MSLKFPKVVRIEPSGACNLKCIHCPTGTSSLKRGAMSDETFNKIYQIVSKHISQINVIVMYHGGEPLLNENIYNWILRLKQLKSSLLIKIVSNGMLMDLSASQKLIDCGLDQLEVSLDGLNFEQNDVIRRNCDGKQVVENVKNLIQLKKKLCIDNPKIFIANTLFANQQSETPSYLQECFGDELRNTEIESIKTTLAMKWPDYTPVNEIKILLKNEECNADICDHIINTTTIRWNGDVVPCCYDLTNQYVLGNIATENIEDILTGEKYKKLINSFHSHQYVSLCANCNYTKNEKIYLSRNFNNLKGD